MSHRSLPLLLMFMLGCTANAVADPLMVVTPRAREIAISQTNRPFLAADRALAPVDLATRGYLETEWLVSGAANVYDWAQAGSDAVVARGASVPYATRILVRRPKDAAKFSGRVIVELLNPTGLYEFAPLWGFSWEHFLRRGDAWVGVTVKPVAAATLRRFDAVRYAEVSFANRRADPCAVTPAAADLPEAENGLAWDLIAQVGALLKSSSKENPLLQINPRRVIAAGYSQTGGYITTYTNALHAKLRLGNGAPIFDGYMNSAGANAAPINQCATPLADDDAKRSPPKIDESFVTVMTESDLNRALKRRTEDADEPSVSRLYELAGAAHSGPFAAGQPAAADLAIAGFTAPAENLCVESRGNFPVGLAFNAIWQQYDDLLVRQLPMTREPRIDLDPRGEVLRDTLGNARGGFRLPMIDVPLAAYRGRSTARTDESRSQNLCALTGAMQKFDAAQLRAQYRTRAEYLKRFNAAVDAAVLARRLTIEDAAAVKSSTARTAPAF